MKMSSHTQEVVRHLKRSQEVSRLLKTSLGFLKMEDRHGATGNEKADEMARMVTDGDGLP